MTQQSKRFYEQVLRCIRQHQMLISGEGVVVGVSGGIDSVMLLHVLYQLRRRLGIRLYVAHLNHGFRGTEAERDADFVRHLAEHLELPYYLEFRDVPALLRQQKSSPQDVARQVRYQFFEEIARQVDAQKIATAHTADDQAETVLIGLIRGVGLAGLGGIRPVLNQRIIRPLLSTSRQQIVDFAQQEGLEHREDSSNASRKYLRNAVRLDLLPLLQIQFNPAIVKSLCRYAQLFQEDAFFIDKIAAHHYTQICKRMKNPPDAVVQCSLERFRKEAVTMQRALIYQAFKEITGKKHTLETRHVRAIIELFLEGTTGKQISLPQGVIARCAYGWGYLQRVATEAILHDEGPVQLPVEGVHDFDRFSIRLSTSHTVPTSLSPLSTDISAGLIQYVDREQITPPIFLRYRRPGDVFQPLGMQGKKRLKKFFIDRKVPKDKRHTIPLLEDANGIFWVVGYAIADRVKITAHTRIVLTCHIISAH